MSKAEAPALMPGEDFGEAHAETAPAAAPARLILSGNLGLEALESLKPQVLELLVSAPGIILELRRSDPPGSAFLQFVCACHRSLAAAGKTLEIIGMDEQARLRLADLGLSPGAVACGLGGCPLLDPLP